MHGDRGPHNIPNLSDLDYGGGFSPTGQPNELWSYGEEAYAIMKKYLVAPVLYQGMTERSVFLPEGTWKDIHSGAAYNRKSEITVLCPLEIIPVFEKL